jgi:integron integrase
MKSNNPKALAAIAKSVDMLRLQRKALATEQCYIHWIGSFIDWLCGHGRDLPDSRTRIEAYLTSMAHRNVSASTQNQAFNAIKWFYQHIRCETVEGIDALRACRPKRHRTALSREDTLALLDCVRDHAGYPTRLLARLLYGCGLRVGEAVGLRIKDLDLAGSRLVVRDGKCNKDRVVIVPCSLVLELQDQVKRARVVWEADQLRRLPVQVPGNLHVKYPNAPFSWQWAFLFPAHHSCRHPRTGETVRFRMHEANIQRAVKQAATALGFDSMATPHVLRHCWATHVIEAGANIRDVQELMGHSSIETTMAYIRPNSNKVPAVL